MSSTITLFQTIQYAKTFVRSAPLIGAAGVENEPALSICNDTLQALLSSPYAWRFNKFDIPPFTTIPYQQDYLLSGCKMEIITKVGGPGVAIVHLNTPTSANGPGLSLSGSTVTALFSDFAPNGTAGLNGPPGSTPVTSGTSVPAIGNLVTITGASQSPYNVVSTAITGLVTAANGGIVGITFTTASTGLTNDGGQGINGINWIQHATLEDYMNTATVRPVHDIEVVAALPKESIIQPPFKICFQTETSLPALNGVYLLDPYGDTWSITVSDIGQMTSTEVEGPGAALILLKDTSSSQGWNLSILADGKLQIIATTNTATTTQLFLQSPNRNVWGIQVANGVLQTTLISTGLITVASFRTWPIPSSQIWSVFLYYQGKAPVKTDLGQTFFPWPDDLGYVLRSGVKAKALDWFEDPRYPTSEIKWQQDILKALDVKDQEGRHEAFFPDLPLMRGG